MAYQNLFNKISEIANHNCLESEMFEIIDAYNQDILEQSEKKEVNFNFDDGYN